MTNNKMRQLLLPGVICILSATSVNLVAGTVSPVQSTARPYKLDVVGPVMVGGSDGRSASFLKEFLPVAEKTVRSTLPERQVIKDPVKMGIDPKLLKLEYDYNVRAYFIGEGAGYRNSLGIYTTGGQPPDPKADVLLPGDDASSGFQYSTTSYDPKLGIQSTNAKLVFPDASSSASYLSSGTGVRSSNEPLLPGDFVQLGKLKSGTQINPFLISDGANGGKDIFTPYASLNPDGLDHFVTLTVTAIPGSTYILIAIEDLRGGGDRDFNDLVVALDIGARNVMSITGAAVPAPPAIWGALAAAGWWITRRRRSGRQESTTTRKT